MDFLTGAWIGAGLLFQIPHPEEVLSRVNQTYTALDSYTDWGTVTFSYRSASGERRGDCRSFNTAFKRPNRLRYELVEPASEAAREKRWITWTASRSDYASWTNWSPRDIDRSTLQQSLLRSWGMSESCGISLKLLAPWALNGPRVTELFNAVLSRENVGSHACWRIEGVCEDGAKASLWVDAKSSLILRYRHAVGSQLDGEPTNEIYTVELHAVGNPSIGVDAVKFIPPGDRQVRRHVRHSHRRRRRKR